MLLGFIFEFIELALELGLEDRKVARLVLLRYHPYNLLEQMDVPVEFDVQSLLLLVCLESPQWGGFLVHQWLVMTLELDRHQENSSDVVLVLLDKLSLL